MTTFWKTALSHGLFLGLALVLFDYALYLAGQTEAGYSTWLMYAMLLVAAYLAARRSRDRHMGGYISFGKAFGSGMVVAMVGGTMLGLFVLLLFAVIDPALLQELKILAEEAMIEQGLPDEQIEEVSRLMEKFFYKPWFLALSTFLQFLLVGSLISLLSAALAKKEPEGSDAFRQATGEV